MANITVTVDGVTYTDDVEPRLLLVHYLRERVDKTGTPIEYDTSNYGACTVHMNGVSVKSCSVLAVQADGAEITTIEGISNGQWHPLQQAFHAEHALQCGYCTPGMIMTADTQAPQAEVGQARPRKEDARLVTGQTNWTDNIVLPGMLHMAFVRSTMAHARITSVDLSAARAMPGVIAAFSGADFAAEQGSLPCAWPV